MIYNVKVAINEVLALAFKDKQKVQEWWKKPSEHLDGNTPVFMWKDGSRGKYKVSMLALKLLDLQ